MFLLPHWHRHHSYCLNGWRVPILNVNPVVILRKSSFLMVRFIIFPRKFQLMRVKQCHKPSPSHHHLYRWYSINHSQSSVVNMALFYPHYCWFLSLILWQTLPSAETTLFCACSARFSGGDDGGAGKWQGKATREPVNDCLYIHINIYRFPKMGVPANHPERETILVYFSIETHGFWDPWF